MTADGTGRPPSADTDRWRLVLGRYADQRLPRWSDDSTNGRAEAALDYLYGREYAGRGAREADGSDGPDTGPAVEPGSLEDSAPHLVEWLGEVRELFPRETVEVIERHALERYDVTALVSDPEVLAHRAQRGAGEDPVEPEGPARRTRAG